MCVPPWTWFVCLCSHVASPCSGVVSLALCCAEHGPVWTAQNLTYLFVCMWSPLPSLSGTTLSHVVSVQLFCDTLYSLRFLVQVMILVIIVLWSFYFSLSLFCVYLYFFGVFILCPLSNVFVTPCTCVVSLWSCTCLCCHCVSLCHCCIPISTSFEYLLEYGVSS